VGGAVLIGMGLPHPSSLADEARRIGFTFAGVGIAVVVMLLANLLSKPTLPLVRPNRHPPARPGRGSGPRHRRPDAYTTNPLRPGALASPLPCLQERA